MAGENRDLKMAPTRCPAKLLLDMRDEEIKSHGCSSYRESVQQDSEFIRERISESDCPGVPDNFELEGELPQYNTVAGQAIAKLCPSYRAWKEQSN